MGHSAKTVEIVPGGHVQFTGASGHRSMPLYYPDPGTVGKVVAAERYGAWVRWPSGSTGRGSNPQYTPCSLLKAVPAVPARPWRLMAASAGLCVAAMVLAVMAYGLVMDLQLLEGVCGLAGAAACLRWGADIDRQVQAVLDVRRSMGAGRF